MLTNLSALVLEKICFSFTLRHAFKQHFQMYILQVSISYLGVKKAEFPKLNKYYHNLGDPSNTSKYHHSLLTRCQNVRIFIFILYVLKIIKPAYLVFPFKEIEPLFGFRKFDYISFFLRQTYNI